MKKILLSSCFAVLLLSGCGENKSEQEEVNTSSQNSITKSKNDEEFINKVTKSSEAITKKVTEASKQIGDIVSETSKEVIKEAKVVTEDLSKKSEEISKKVTSEVKESANKLEDSINDIMASSSTTSDTGKQLFLKCAGCHGQNGEKMALGKSQIIKNWDKQKVIDALIGYKNGTYGGTMKGVMKSQVMNLSDEEIDILGEYIFNL